MRLDRSARSRRRFGTVRVRPVQWEFHFPQRKETFSFMSLSEMAQWLRSHAVQDDEPVLLIRNSRVIYRGVWGEGLHHTPTA